MEVVARRTLEINIVFATAVSVHVPKNIYGQYLHEVANACIAKWKLWRVGL